MSLESRLAGLGDRVPRSLWVLSLGLLTWASAALLPSLYRRASLPLHAFSLLGLSPATLLLGLRLTRAQSSFAPYALLCAFPITLALSASRLDHDLALATYSPSVLMFSLLSLMGYLSAASTLSAEPPSSRSVDQRPLGEVSPVNLETRKQTLGKLVLGTVLCGGLVLVSLAGWGTPAQLRERWGRSAAEGATLTALVAGLVGALALSLVGPALRAQRGPVRTPGQRTGRVVWLLLVALSGAVVYLALKYR
jgi:hypothetical protein